MADKVASQIAGNMEAGQPLLKKSTTISETTSHNRLPYNENLNEAKIKNAFIKKVYGLLTAQLVITAGIAVGIFFLPDEPKAKLVSFTLSAGGVVLYLVVTVALLCAIHINKNRYPLNLILLFSFAAFLGLDVGAIVCVYAAREGGPEAIFCALATTAVIFCCLSLYAAFSKKDFSFLGAFLFVALFANIVLGLLAFLFKLSALMWLYNVLGVLIFSGFILYDTDQIVNKVTLETACMGEAICGALELYLDVINLFLHLLAIFGDR